MEENNDIDKIFRENLEGFEVDPPEKVWTSIDAALDKKKKSRGFWFLLTALMIGLISFGTYEYMTMDSNTGEVKKEINAVAETKTTETTSSTVSENKNTTEVPDANRNGASEQAGNETKTSVAENSSAENKTGKSSLTSEKISQAKPASATIASTEKPKSNFSEKKTKRTTDFSPAKTMSAETVSRYAEPSSGGSENNSLSMREGNNTNQNRNSFVENDNRRSDPVESKSAEIKNTESTPAVSENNVTAVEKNNSAVNDNQQPEKIADVTTPAVSEPATSENNNSSAKENTAENKVDDQTVTQPKDSASAVAATEKPVAPAVKTNGLISLLKKIGSHTSIGIFYSPDYAVNRTTGTSTASSKETGYSWASGLKLGYDLSKRFSISVGANYSSYSKSETFSSVYVESDSSYREFHSDDHDHNYDHGHGSGHGGGSHGGGGGSGGGNDDDEGGPGHDGCHYVVHTSCGDIDLGEIPPSATGDEESGDTLSLKTNVASTVEFINVPLKLRFNMRSRKLTYFIEAGGSANFIINSNADISIGTYSESNIVSGLTNIQYSALLNLGVEYRFYKGLSLFLEPNLRYSITPINDSGTEKSYPYFIGGNAGLMIHF